MRYSARWSNGCWKVFDHFKFDDVAKRATKRDAEDAALDFNAAALFGRRFPDKHR